MSDIRIPGFTAEASVYRIGAQHLMTERPSRIGPITPQAPFIGEWLARLDSVAAFYSSGGGISQSPADIAERRMCLALVALCRKVNIPACRRMDDNCPHR